MSDTPLLPHFVIGGAPRSGTTALATVLDEHPRIVMARPFIPEPKVFAIPWSEPGEVLARYAAYFGPEHIDLVRGEKSSQYLYLEDLPAAMAPLLPEVRVVFVVREPVARAYSHWAWSRRNGLEDLPFERALEVNGQRTSPLPERPWIRPFDYLLGARYAEHARRWHDVFGDRVRFALFEELVESRQALAGLQEFVGVEPRDLGTLPSGLENETASDTEPIDPALAERLRERLQPAVEDFAAVTGVDVGRWGLG